MLASFGIKQAPKGYFSMFLLLETGMLGVFVALDFVLFYVFWEVMLLPMYFLIGIWGGPRRVYAAIKFFLYTLFGSVLMLVVILSFYLNTEPHTFDVLRLIQADFSGTTLEMFGRVWDFSKVMFLLLFVGFAIKVPIFPFHTWLPDAHVEAPTAISVILAGVLLKMGTYGLMRFSFPILPESAIWFSGALAVLALINIVYGALCAMAQQDLKKLVAYSSISHMGFVLLGMSALTPTGMNGAILQMFNHGTVTAMLFLLVGVIYDRAHHREIGRFGGLATNMPVYAAFTGLAWFAALGLPSLSSFISELMCLLGAFNTYRTITIVSASGILLGAAYMLWSYQRIFLGPLNERYKGLPDIETREILSLVPLAAIVILVGIYPMPVISLMRASSAALVAFTLGT
jgi:NADH-quinone oxidoreductase subunit M